MIIRVVKMTIAPSEVENFRETYTSNMKHIRKFKGCKNLELLQDEQYPNIFMTYSFWKSHKALEEYRKSDLFKGIWKQVKPMFAEKPLAWSLKQQFKL